MTAPLKKTALHDMHHALGAKMAGFAGFDMPLYYQMGALKEHHFCRDQSALFDVSHMGQIDITAKEGTTDAILAALETLIPANLISLRPGQQRYGVFLNQQGGVLDDLMVMNFGSWVRLVVNAACVEQDFSWVTQHLSGFDISLSNRSLLAVQGPKAAEAIGQIIPGIGDMMFMQIAEFTYQEATIQASRAGYTGEDGFEISLPNSYAEPLASELLKTELVQMAGLVARDSLRLEAGLCLYGQDMDPNISAVSAGLQWAIAKIRRRGGARAGGFIGDAATLEQLETGAPYCRIGAMAPKGVPPRAGTKIYNANEGGDEIGVITSGSPAPSVGQPVAMVRLDSRAENSGDALFADVRGRRLALERVQMPFFAHRYFRAKSSDK